MYRIEFPATHVQDDAPSVGRLVVRHAVLGGLYVAGVVASLMLIAIVSFGESTCPPDENRGSLTALRMSVVVPTLCLVALCVVAAVGFRAIRARPAHAAVWAGLGVLTAMAGALCAATIQQATWCF